MNQFQNFPHVDSVSMMTLKQKKKVGRAQRHPAIQQRQLSTEVAKETFFFLFSCSRVIKFWMNV